MWSVGDYSGTWAFLEAAFAVLSALWIVIALALLVTAVGAYVAGRRTRWVSRADDFVFPELHDPREGSRFEPV